MREDREWLSEILREIDLILKFIEGKTRKDLDEDLMLQRAVLHSMIIIGEATSHLSRDFLAQHPSVPWQGIKSMRNHLVHSYFSLDLNLVWETATRDLRPLKTFIESVLN